ncbi:MAG: 3-hydroxyacyl-CoA dehydrogenase/enoyl-CoA hydratase family protein [Planctomycetota bacterium]|nr:MAG: 3-hydroxyacyl-CoA dehydrogenase/enoyl-CoA hydratase family protein [Planctomycetota bacterium]
MPKPTANNPLLLTPVRPMPARVAIVGAGTIGPDIGYYLKSAIPGLELVLVDVSQESLDRATRRIEGYVEKGLAKRKLSAAQADDVRRGIVATLDYADMAGCDWVIEAATEQLDLKRRIFSQIEAIVGPEALITSNTSSLPAERLFSHLEHPERATVTHFFAPAFRNPAVEVVAWERSDPELIGYLRWLFCITGKVPLVTADALCFMLDRVFDNWCNEAALLLGTATAAEVDSVAAEFVHAGPFFVLNMANGNPIIVETNTLQMEEEGQHYRPADIFRSVDRWVTGRLGERAPVEAETAAAVRDRLAGVLLSQSVDILDRGIGDPADLDLGCRLALGFKQGPLELMQRLGPDEVSRILDRFAAERTGMPMPARPLASYLGFLRHLLVDEVDGVLVLTLRRPQAMNALDDAVTDELLSVISQREGDAAVEGFVITGYGTRAFCAGADIGRFPQLLGQADEAAQFARDCSRLLVHLDACPKPVVAALNGMALGGGLELAIRCHVMVAVRDAWLQFPEVTLGIAPGIGAMVVPYRRWPEAAGVFHDMLRLATRLDAERAHELGVVDVLVDDHAALMTAAVQRVKQLQGEVARIPDAPVAIAPPQEVEPVAARGEVLSRQAIGIIGQAIQDAAASPSLGAALDVGYEAFGASACTPAAKEGIEAFLQRRKPDFATTG